MDYDYSSTQVNIEGAFKKLLLKEAMKIKSKDLFYSADGPHGRETIPHVTVKYGIHTDYPIEVERLFEGIDEIEFEFDKISLFEPGDKYDVVKIEIKDIKNLRKLNKRISSKLECTDTFKEYNPHCTLAYVKAGTGKNYVGKSLLTGKRYKASEIFFSGKEGNEVSLSLNADSKEFIGVDFDGTLAFYGKWRGWNHLGKPVPKMLKRVKDWLKQGKRVKIFTARYYGLNRDRVLPVFKKWFKDNGLPELELTNEKTPDMYEIWDDRAVSVIKNKGFRR
jgi:hypothetical protein